MKNIILLVLINLGICNACCFVKDILIFNEKEFTVGCDLLGSRLEKITEKYVTCYKSTANHRGYVGSWAIIDSSLYLTDLKGLIFSDTLYRLMEEEYSHFSAFPSVPDACEGDLGKGLVEMSFPKIGPVVNSRIKATWISGDIVLHFGGEVGCFFERDSLALLTISNGIINSIQMESVKQYRNIMNKKYMDSLGIDDQSVFKWNSDQAILIEKILTSNNDDEKAIFIDSSKILHKKNEGKYDNSRYRFALPDCKLQK